MFQIFIRKINYIKYLTFVNNRELFQRYNYIRICEEFIIFSFKYQQYKITLIKYICLLVHIKLIITYVKAKI